MDNNLAVLIDFENIAAGTEKEGLGRFDVNALMTRIKDKGRVLVARSYADWGRFSRFKQSLLTANVTMMELTSHGMQDKNRADIALVVDALELAFTKDYLDTYVIVSGDSDFTPLILKMRELNKRVIGVGTRGSVSRLLIQACDEFIYYDSVISRPEPKRSGGAEPMSAKSAYQLLVDALEGLQREDPESPLASIVKTAMLRKSPDFSETDLGYHSFARFLETAQDRGYVKLSRDPKAGGYRVDSVDRGDVSSPDPATEESVGAPRSDAPYRDSYLPEGTGEWLRVLAKAGLDPLATPTRLAVLEQVEALSSERKGKRRKITVPFARDEVKKRLRRTHPDLPAEAVKGVLHALLLAGLLMHRDGQAVRTASAPFLVNKSATQLNQSLMNLYLGQLRAEGCDLSDTGRLAELFLGDPRRKRDVEETLAWLASGGGSEMDDGAAGDDGPVDLDDNALDDLLTFDEGATHERTLESDEHTVPSISRSEIGSSSDLDALLSFDSAPPVAPEAEADAPASEDDKPKKKRRRSRKKKSDEGDDGAEGGGDDLDALLEASE